MTVVLKKDMKKKCGSRTIYEHNTCPTSTYISHHWNLRKCWNAPGWRSRCDNRFEERSWSGQSWGNELGAVHRSDPEARSRWGNSADGAFRAANCRRLSCSNRCANDWPSEKRARASCRDQWTAPTASPCECSRPTDGLHRYTKRCSTSARWAGGCRCKKSSRPTHLRIKTNTCLEGFSAHPQGKIQVCSATQYEVRFIEKCGLSNLETFCSFCIRSFFLLLWIKKRQVIIVKLRLTVRILGR